MPLLPEIIQAGRAIAGFTHTPENRESDPGQHRDVRDDHEQLDERECGGSRQ